MKDIKGLQLLQFSAQWHVRKSIRNFKDLMREFTESVYCNTINTC